MYGLLAPRAHNYGRQTQNGFGGINANLNADSGEVRHVLDMTSDEYPLLATRPPRYKLGDYEGEIIGTANINGERAYVTAYGYEQLAYHYAFWYKGASYPFRALLSPKRAVIAAVGDYAVVLPFQMYFDLKLPEVEAEIPAEFLLAWLGESYDGYKQISGYTFPAELPEYSYEDGEWYELVGSVYHEFSDGELIEMTAPENKLPYNAPKYKEWHGLYQYSALSDETGELIYVGEKLGSMKATVQSALQIGSGTYAGEQAHGNEILLLTEGVIHHFRVGDAVTLSGCSVAANNKTAVIREIGTASIGTDEAERTVPKLVFDDNTFRIFPDTEDEYIEPNPVTIERFIPEMDVIFHHKNRLWGADGRQIYCSAQGDPLVWGDYEGTARSCWSADTGITDKSGITGGISYTYPRFFSQNSILTVYGEYPSEYSTVVTNAKGTAAGAGESFAVVNGVLCYLSDAGFMAYSGSLPQKIDYQLGNKKILSALAASDGIKYYTWAKDEDKDHLYVYDSERGLWHEESGEDIEGLWSDDNLSFASGGEIWTLGRQEEPEGAVEEDEVRALTVFADYTMGTVGTKQVKELIIRHDVGGTLTVRVYIDGKLDPSFTRTITGAGKRTTVITGIPKRFDHLRLELEGRAPWVVYSIAYEVIEGTTR